MNQSQTSSTVVIGYIIWLFGFTGSHRFYFGRPKTGLLYFCTLGLFGIGWLIDIVLIPRMAETCDVKREPGPIDYNVSWLLLTFLGAFGAHRFYMHKWATGILYFFTGGLFGVGWAYDLWTWNDQVAQINLRENQARLP